MDKPDMNPQMGMDMMKKMMGGGEGGGPMQMCKDMTSSIKKTAALAAFATPELHALFGEWLEGKEKDVLGAVARSGKHVCREKEGQTNSQNSGKEEGILEKESSPQEKGCEKSW